MNKQIIWIGVFVGSILGGLVPMLWHGSLIDGIVWSTIGGVAGIWAGWKISQLYF